MTHFNSKYGMRDKTLWANCKCAHNCICINYYLR